MRDQPTGEWTEERLREYLAGYSSYDLQLRAIAKLINAAIDEAVDASEQEILLLRGQLAAEREKAGMWTLQDGKSELLDGDIEKLRTPDYHQLNKHAGRNDRLLHAVLCAYVKHHYYEDNHIGWDELDNILFNAICNETGDDAFCEWTDKLK